MTDLSRRFRPLPGFCSASCVAVLPRRRHRIDGRRDGLQRALAQTFKERPVDLVSSKQDGRLSGLQGHGDLGETVSAASDGKMPMIKLPAAR